MNSRLKMLLALSLLCAAPAFAMSFLPSKKPAENAAPATPAPAPTAAAPAPVAAPTAAPTLAAPPPAPAAATPAPAAAPAFQAYRYAHNDGEYSVDLPEAPTVTTLWGDNGNIPYLENPPKEGALGELATFRRVDAHSGEFFDVKITFLKADSSFLAKLTEDKMKKALEDDFKTVNLTDAQSGYSANADNSLKWATLTGFSIDTKGRPAYNAGHYLTGKQSVMVLKIQYSIENETFTSYYKTLADNITYLAQ